MNVDRREFLKGLLALTTVPVLANFNLELPEEVEKAWATLNEKPYLFQVNSFGVLDDESYLQEPLKHKDVYGIPQEIKNMEDLLYCLDWDIFAPYVYSRSYDFLKELSKEDKKNLIIEQDGFDINNVDDADEINKIDEEAITQWSNSLQEDGFETVEIIENSNSLDKTKFIEEVNSFLQKWLEEDVNISEEEVYAEIPLYGASYVSNFFEREHELTKKLQVSLYEGFHDYQYAKLDISIEEANEICKNENIPIRFQVA